MVNENDVVSEGKNVIKLGVKDFEGEGGKLEELVEEVKVITSLINDQNRQDEIEEEWQILGKVFDRLFFFSFVLIFLLSSLLLLLPVYLSDS